MTDSIVRMTDNRSFPSAGSTTRRSRAAVYALVLSIAVSAAGCSTGLDTSYGTSSRGYVTTSVNGVDVLAGMFADAGHEVGTRRILLSSTMHQVQTLVWIPNDFEAPSDEVCTFFYEWLEGGTGRTLVYVGRSFDAAPLYWRKMIPRAPKDQQKFYRRAEAAAQAMTGGAHESDRLECAWFDIERGKPHRVKTLSGPWAEDINAAKAEIEMCDRLLPTEDADDLLSGGDETIAWRYVDDDPDGNQVIVVANGSFLLNLPLVNHEHRKLAGKLIDEVGPPGRVVFLQSGPGDPPIDPPAGESALARLFGTWPIGIILLHSAMLGVIFCFARWPIFGRAKSPPTETIADFGHHVAAVGELLERTHDRAYALEKLPVSIDAAKADAAGARQATVP